MNLAGDGRASSSRVGAGAGLGSSEEFMVCPGRGALSSQPLGRPWNPLI